MLVDLVRTVTTDGMRLDGALFAPAENVESRVAVDAVLCLHGVGASFYSSSTLEALVPHLTELGLSTLIVNTRGHDSVHTAVMTVGRRRQGAALEIVDESRLDIAGWCKLLAERGMRRILLLGHSLGAVKAIYSQALEPHSQVVGIVAASAPRLSYAAFSNSFESSLFLESMTTAESMAKAGRGSELFTAKFPFPLLISADSYIDKYGPAERYNILRFAAQMTVPSLCTYGSKELATGGIAFAGVPEALRDLPGKCNTLDIEIVENADHVYTGVTDKLGSTIVEWLIGRLPVAST